MGSIRISQYSGWPSFEQVEQSPIIAPPVKLAKAYPMKTLLTLITLSVIFFNSAYAQRMYDSNGRQIGRVDSERYYDGSGRQIGRVDGSSIYDSSGRQLGRIDGDRVYDGSGRQIGRADGLRRMQMIIYFYFFI
jgi:hypothetical protein